MEEGSPLGGELEITSIGVIYCGPWDKKYWSSSRGKDRYPYPVGYHAVRTHGGNVYKMEIREGVKGPLFMVTSTDGESSTGHTPDIAWVNFQKNVPRVKTGIGKRFSSKIDGIQLFGFRNPFVQRLLRELVANIQGIAEPDIVLPTARNEVSRFDKMMQPPDSFACSDLLEHTEKHHTAGKRGVRDKVCTRDRKKAVRAKRICYHHVTNDSRAGNLEKENVIFSHSEIKNQNLIKEKSFLSSRNHIIQIQDSQHHPGFLPKSAAAASDDTCQQVADCKCRGIFHHIPERHILSQEMGDSDNSVDKHVIYVRENSSTGQDPCPTGVNNVSADDNSTKNAIRLSNAKLSPSGVLPKAVESGEMLAFENYSELYISDTCDVEKSDAADFQSVRGSSTSINPEPECSSLPDAALKELVNDSLPETGPLSGSSNSGSEKADLSASDKELANSMISFLLPRAVPLLEKTYVRRKSRHGSQAMRLGATSTLFKASSAEHMAKNDQLTDKIYEEGLDANRLMNGTQEKVPETLDDQISISCQMAKMEDAIDDCLPYKSSDHTLYLEDPKHMIPDSYEDDKFVCDVHPNEHTNVACESECKTSAKSRENNNTSKSLNILGERAGKSLDSEILFPKETIKNDYLTDSLVEYLEEAFNDDLRLEKERSDADCLGASVNHNLLYLNSDVVNNEDSHEEKEISETMLHYNNVKCKMECTGQCSIAANASSNNLNEGDMCTLVTIVEVPQNKNGKTSKDIQSLVLDNQIEFGVLDATEQKVCELGDQTGFNHSLAVESTNILLVNVNGDKMLLSDDGQHTDRTNKFQRLSNKSQFSGNCNVPFSESIICRHYMDSDVTAARPTEISSSVQTKLTSYQSKSAVVSQTQNVTDYADVNVKHSEFHDHSVNRTEENFTDSMSKSHPSFQFYKQAYQGPVNCVPSQNIEVMEQLLFSDEKPATRSIRHEQTTNICQRQLNSNAQFDDSLFRAARSDEVLDESFELTGCYRQPKPVLFILLRPYEDDLQISVICGIRESDERFVFIYKVPLKDQGEISPYFIGYTSLMLPLLPEPAIGNTTHKGSCLQFTPDGQSLVFVSSIRAPLCRTQSMHCSCSMCKSVCHDENTVRIGKVFMGYVLPSATLTTVESLSCIAVCEPNYVIAAEVSGTLHVWLMNCNWSKSLEEFVLPSFDYLRPAVELKTVPKSDCLIVGHNSIGSFGLWNILKRVLLARFLNPGNLIFQILPIGMFNFQDEISTSSCQNMKLMQETSHHCVAEAAATPLQDDNAVWILVSADTDSDPQVVNHPKEQQPTSNASWRPALLVRNIVVMGHMVDFRASSVDVSDGYGYIGTLDGVLYKCELSTGKKLSNLLRVQLGSITCTAVDSKSGVVAVADEKCRLLILRQKIM